MKFMILDRYCIDSFTMSEKYLKPTEGEIFIRVDTILCILSPRKRFDKWIINIGTALLEQEGSVYIAIFPDENTQESAKKKFDDIMNFLQEFN